MKNQRAMALAAVEYPRTTARKPSLLVTAPSEANCPVRFHFESVLSSAAKPKVFNQHARRARYSIAIRLALTVKSRKDHFMNTIPISRRDFARLLGAGAAAALVRPLVSFA
jgi:hypothetical protein